MVPRQSLLRLGWDRLCRRRVANAAQVYRCLPRKNEQAQINGASLFHGSHPLVKRRRRCCCSGWRRTGIRVYFEETVPAPRS